MKSNFGGNFSFLCFAKSEILQILPQQNIALLSHVS